MPISEKTMDRPEFARLNGIANDHVVAAAAEAGFNIDDLFELETHTGRIVDDLTMLLMRLHRAKEGL